MKKRSYVRLLFLETEINVIAFLSDNTATRKPIHEKMMSSM